MKKVIFRWIKIILLVYCIAGIALYYLQDRILFHPEAMDKSQRYGFIDKLSTEITIPYDHETELNVIKFQPQDDTVSRGVVLYFHGNAKNIGWYAKYVPNFTKNNYEVWMIDYPGFGKSKGVFAEQKLYDYALQLYKLARVKYQPAQIVIYGKSLGTGIAAELASVRDCKCLLLETPYYSMSSLVAHYFPIYPVDRMLHYHFPTNEYLPRVTAPITIFHGTDDGVVPYGNASKLIPLLKSSDEFVTIPGGTHNNLSDFPRFHERLDAALLR